MERLVFRYVAVEMGPRALEERDYIALLDGANPKTVKQAMAALALSHPERAAPKVLAAFAALKAGDSGEALSLAEKSGLDWPNQDPRWRLVYASILRANRLRPAAIAMIAKIDTAKLRAPERAMLQDVQASP